MTNQNTIIEALEDFSNKNSLGWTVVKSGKDVLVTSFTFSKHILFHVDNILKGIDQNLSWLIHTPSGSTYKVDIVIFPYSIPSVS